MMRQRLQVSLGVVLGLMFWSAWTVGCRAQAPAAPSLREDFRRVVVGDRKPSALNPQPVSQMDVGELKVERVRFTPEEGQSAVALIYRPNDGAKHPAVIVQHFLGGSKDHFLFVPLMTQMAKRGFVVAAIDGRFRGERQNGKSLEAAMAESLRTGKGRPWLYDTAYDILRFVDYLQTRPDVDPQRIGMTGLSEGGILTWMCAALDDRIKVAVPLIGVTQFSEALQDSTGPEYQAKLKLFEPALKEYAKDLGQTEINGKLLRQAWDKLTPGMLDRFDAPKLIPEIAPRPLLIISHEQDELFPIAGAKVVHEAAKTRYKELKAEDRLDFRVAPGLKHAAFNLAGITGMMDWMERWLKAPAP